MRVVVLMRSLGRWGVPAIAVALALSIAVLVPCCASGEMGVPLTSDEEDVDGGVQVPAVPEVPEDPEPTTPPVEEPAEQPSAPDGVETLPPVGEGYGWKLPTDPSLLVVALIVIGVLTTYAPGQIRRMRIESAQNRSMHARLALAEGRFADALEGFDRAIEEAHAAYTRRTRPGRPSDWVLDPDPFYVSLWRGRAASLMGLGRRGAAAAASMLAEELEASLPNRS